MKDVDVKILQDLVNKEAIKPLKRYIKKYLKLLEINCRISIETTNLLKQASNTLQSVDRLLKSGEIVDSATLMRSSMEKIMMAMMIYFDKDNTYEEFKNDVVYLGTDLIKRGFLNKKIAVIRKNSYKWCVSYLAASIVGIVVPIDKELHSDDVINFMNVSETACILGDSKNLSSVIDDIDKLDM